MKKKLFIILESNFLILAIKERIIFPLDFRVSI